jgi:mannosyltransferase
MNARRWTILGLATALIVGAWLRVAGIGRLSLWYDEAFTAWAIDRPPRQIIPIIRNDTAPPLYYLLLHEWTLLFGRSETGLRSFSAALGIATMVLVAAIARAALKRSAAVVAATWLFALSYAQIWYSQEARAYELTSFWMAMMLWSLLRHLQRPSQKRLGVLTVCVIGAAYTHNFMLLYIAAVGLAGLVFPSELTWRKRFRDLLIVAACLAASFLPWLGPLASQVRRVNANFWLPTPTFDAVCAVLARISGVAHYWSWDWVVHVFFRETAIDVPRLVVLAQTIGVVLIFLRLRGEDRRTAIGLAIATLAAPLAAVAESLLNRPILLPAAVLPSTVVYPVLAAGMLVWPARRSAKFMARVVIALALLASGATLWGYEQERSKEDWRGAAADVAAMPAANRWILFVDQDSEHAFDYYYHSRPGENERPIAPGEIGDLLRRIGSGGIAEIVLINSHSGWIDRRGVVHHGYSDPNALVTKAILGVCRLTDRIDLPPEWRGHEITIYRCLPRPASTTRE